MKTLYTSTLAALFLFYIKGSVLAQPSETLKYCGTTEAQNKFINLHPEMISQIEFDRESLEKHTQNFQRNNSSKISGVIYTIPVVFHILHDYGAENIPDDQIYDAMRILNEDYRKLNADTSIIVSAFKSVASDSEIEFRLAQKDPNGNCTNGIDRIWTMKTYAGGDAAKLNYWPRDKYLNVWVVKTITQVSGAAGYAYNPGNTWPIYDGIIILHNFIGSIGTSNINNSRALTHEVGHWFNLDHTWGNTNEAGVSCGDDNVSDTPITKGHLFSCPLNDQACASGIVENIQNYMEYSYCCTMFTQGQKNRMRAALTSSTAGRNNLWSTSNRTATGTDVNPFLCSADFTTSSTIVCAGKPAQFYDASYNSEPTLHIWSFNGATPATSSIKNPIVTYYTPGVYNVTLTAGNGSNTYTKTKNSYITVLPAPGKSTPYSEGFETGTFPNADWMIVNPDNSSTYKWTLATGVSYSGSKCLKMNNYNNDTLQHDDLLSSSIDLSNLTAATIKFKVAYCQRTTTTNDKLTLYVSTNCGQTWSPRFGKTGSALATTAIQTSAFTPTNTSQWVEYSASLTSTFLVENVRLKFVFDADGGNNLYLDDINITGTYKSVPVLASPLTNSINVSSNPMLDWKSAGTVDSYEYQLDKATTFNSAALVTGSKSFITLVSDSTDTEFQASGLSLNTKYYWRVRSITSGTPSAWTTTWNFTTLNVITGDANGNGVIDGNEIAGDANGNGVIDGNETAGDINGNGTIDYPNEASGDTNGNGVIDGTEVPGDRNGDGVYNSLDWITSAGQAGSGSENISIYPNPAETIFYLEFNLEKETALRATIYDVLGKKISSVMNGSFSAGSHRIEFNTASLESGVYFIMIDTGGKVQARKIIIRNIN